MPLTNKQLIDVKMVIKETISELLKDEEFISSFVKKVEQKLCVEVDLIKSKVDSLEEKLISLEKENDQLYSQLNAMEMHQKRNNLRIIGMKEEKGEDAEKKVLDMMSNKLKIDLPVEVINECKRIGPAPAKGNKSRVILLSLTNYSYKHLIIKNRRLLKGTKIIITEDLTKQTYTVYKEAITELGETLKIWTIGGNVYTMVNDSKCKISNSDDIAKIKDDIADVDV